MSSLNELHDLIDITKREVDSTFEFVSLIALYKSGDMSDLQEQRLLQFILPEKFSASPEENKASQRVFNKIPFSISTNIYIGLLSSLSYDKYIRPQMDVIFVESFPKEHKDIIRVKDISELLYGISLEIIKKRKKLY